MKRFLRKLRLIDHLTIKLPISKTDFVNKLNEITEISSTRIFYDAFDLFFSSKKEFKGQIDLQGFELRRRRRLFDNNVNMAIANGTFSENNEQLNIDVDINGFNNIFLVFYIFLIIFYLFIFFNILNSERRNDFTVILIMLIPVTFSFLFPYFMMRRSVERFKYELERELFYLTKQ
jgi:hypothetical protein